MSRDDDEDDDEGFDQVSSFKGVAKSFQLNFAPGIRNLHARFQRAIVEAANQLQTLQRAGRSLKYYLTLRCNFYKPTDPNTTTDDPCIFNSETCTLLPSTSIKTHIEINYNSIMHAVENYETSGSGKSLILCKNVEMIQIQFLITCFVCLFVCFSLIGTNL